MDTLEFALCEEAVMGTMCILDSAVWLGSLFIVCLLEQGTELV